jgi:phosphohistidine phosphatase SixA
MKVAVFRHAEKQSEWGHDPSLSLKGEKQSHHLKEWIRDGKIPAPTRLASSPKTRALLTFSPLNRALGIKLEKLDALNERQPEENLDSFKQRVRQVIAEFSVKSEDVIFLCTHLDWIEEFLSAVPSDTEFSELLTFSWAPASFLLFDVQEIWHLEKRGHIE